MPSLNFLDETVHRKKKCLSEFHYTRLVKKKKDLRNLILVSEMTKLARTISLRNMSSELESETP